MLMSPDAVVVRWEDPPMLRARDIWARAIEELQKRPGVWALVLDNADAGYARQSAARCLKSYGCEVKTRSNGELVSVWARWPEGT